MKGFFSQLVQRFAYFMRGRNGLDQLALTMLIVSLAVQLLSSILGLPFLYLLSIVLYILTLLRVFTRRSYKREAENEKFMTLVSRVRTGVRQFFKRLRQSRQYKYFKCPECKALLRLTRGQGEKDITCPKCGHSFRMRA